MITAMSFKTIANATLSADYASMEHFDKMVSKTIENVKDNSEGAFKKIWYTSLLNLYSLQSSLAAGKATFVKGIYPSLTDARERKFSLYYLPKSFARVDCE